MIVYIIRSMGASIFFLVLYVDEILPANSDTDLLHEAKILLAKNSEMKVFGYASLILGIQMH